MADDSPCPSLINFYWGQFYGISLWLCRMKWMKCSIADSLRPEPIRGDCDTHGSFCAFSWWERGNGDVVTEEPGHATGAKSTSFCTKKNYIPWITLVLSWTTLLGLGFICHTYKRLYISLQCSSFRRKPQLLLIYICLHSTRSTVLMGWRKHSLFLSSLCDWICNRFWTFYLLRHLKVPKSLKLVPQKKRFASLLLCQTLQIWIIMKMKIIHHPEKIKGHALCSELAHPQ